MKRALIVSDSHGSSEVLERLKEKHRSEVDVMLHCGDSELAADHSALSGFSVVRGNCDYGQKLPDELVEEIDGQRLFVTHGHLYSVKSTLMNLHYRARELNADIVCFGHSHVLGAEMIDGILFINPGSILLPRQRLEKTYVILELSEKELILRTFDIDKGELTGLEQSFALPKLK
ncbi:YfcE family phosphodiesterase [Bacillus canaveralius]|uniref:Phosphoesterase n=1 Tax=Bacillus canaveralius TaxID=1403243 RepID=A0A2N5GQ70_9BACI|nr:MULTISPECIES: metallophosphoesterase [Bacillus]PLR83099.1 YfcE family phosphodiesterase [Bacillus sp. V33-4]PLR85025.1 YfcE family phosphodiesterase [Bacillus canaveralius]PLR93286.1 YfcE family phosphodiesterase [Bacillus canaveralius]RSK52485.1 metallophosphoesterase [Bacillus canaveralius]